MGLLDLLKGSPKIGGEIGYFGLAEWWLSTFTKEEREYIESKFKPLGVGGAEERPLTQGQITYSSGRVAQLLSGFATNFYKPQDRRIARIMLSKAEELAKKAGNVLDLHFVYAGMIKTYYADRDYDSQALGSAIAACERQIDLAPSAAEAWKREYPGELLPGHTGYTQLAIIREKQKDFAAAVSVSQVALEQGWAGDWEQRIARNEKRLESS